MNKLFSTLSKKTHLIFDFDETIARLNIDWSNWRPNIIKIIKKYDPSFEYHGGGINNWIISYTEKYGRSIRNDFVKFQAEFEKNGLKGYAKNIDLIEYIKNNDPQKNYLLTNNVMRTVLPILDEIGLKDRFEKIVALDTVFFLKPHPEGIMKIIDKNISLSEYVVVGDSEKDKQAARAARVDFVKISF